MAAGNFSAKDISHITKFDGTNFTFWKYRLKLVLETHGLLETVEGTDIKPTPIVLLVDGSNAATVAVRKAEIAKWKQRDVTSRNFILSSLDEKCQRALMSCGTANLMWTRLKAQYELSSLENQHLLRTKFMQYEYEQGHDIMSHITSLEVIAAQLSDLGIPVSDGEMISKILWTLPPSYKQFHTIWNQREDSRKTLPLLILGLQSEETLNQMSGLAISKNEDAAYFASRGKAKYHPTSENKPNQAKPRFETKTIQKSSCGFCRARNHKSSHREEDCWRKEAYLEGKREAAGDATHLATAPLEKETPTEKPFYHADYAFHSTESSLSPVSWYADSGASQHMTDQRSVFASFRPIPPGTRAIKGIGKDNEPLFALGIGDIKIKTRISKDWHDGIIYEVLYVPNLGATLFSIGAATERGVKAIFDSDGVTCVKNEKVVATGTRVGKKLYVMNIKFAEQQTEDMALVAKQVPLQVWHERLGHVCHTTIKKMSKLNVADGLLIDDRFTASTPCEGCLMGKQHRLPFPTDGRTRATRIGGIIHGDVCGPMPVPSLGGSRYFVTFRDDFTGYGVVNFMKCKSEAFTHLKNFVALVKTKTGRPIETLRSDNGGEYTSNELEAWLKSEGIRHETCVPKTPEQNGVAERYNRTITESMRSMLHSAKLGEELWAEAVDCAVYLQNRVLCSAMEGMTPYHGWHGRKSNLSHLRAFGCVAYMHIPKTDSSKLDSKSLKCKLVGYSDTQKAFRLLDPVSKKVKISRDVIFDEGTIHLQVATFGLGRSVDSVSRSVLRSGEGGGATPTGRAAESNSVNSATPHRTVEHAESLVQDNRESDIEEEAEPFHGFSPQKPTVVAPLIRSPRIRRETKRLIADPNFLSYSDTALLSHDLVEPQSYEEAIISPQAQEWKAAMQEEMDSLTQHGTWQLEKLPEGKRPVKNEWIFKVNG